MKYSRIIGTGGYLPEKVLTNKDLESTIETSDEWITSRTGIRERRIAADDEFTVDLAEAAALNAIEAASVSRGEIDLIIVATTTADQVFPSTACLLQQRLGMEGDPAFDVQAVCAGFLFALGVADKFVRTGAANCALVIGAETFSRIIDWSDRRTCVLFGDGAGAVVLRADNSPGLLSTHLHSDGKYKDLLCVPVGVSRNFSKVQAGAAYTTMEGTEVFRWAVKAMSDIITETLDANDMQKDDLDWLIPHQANIRIINAVGARAKIPNEKVVVTVDRHGNTSAASVPLALDQAVRDGRVKSGQHVLLEGFGGGFTWGSALIKM
ncbi:MAG: ketoacyl-ACP synthase III [Gammaproteobacteria bacterium]|nr:ketoacyl-ACP synthase III [Gammaproteobacteria bacterium]MDA7995185.1 ketoacyl-ACP synthase III [Gammaproteobacteria bacterium]MDA8024371.1 ketoacyl-ACP synthase III [Gammaproteobacteria bacterium]CAJ2377184.1 MAG: beta-ketoacyl-(acyl carrier protein) synthase III [Arenicellales bacterium IbO2]